jgi:hypothetical protein
VLSEVDQTLFRVETVSSYANSKNEVHPNDLNTVEEMQQRILKALKVGGCNESVLEEEAAQLFILACAGTSEGTDSPIVSKSKRGNRRSRSRDSEQQCTDRKSEKEGKHRDGSA